MTYQIFPEKIPGFLLKILQAFPTTLAIMATSLLLALALGAVVAWAQLCGRRVPGALARGWVSLMRGVPSLVMIFLLFFGLPQVVKAVSGASIADANKMYFVVGALALLASANMGELMRSSYQAVPRAQTEAALACGMTPRQAFVRITLPQAAAIAVPLLGNATVSLFKDTSLGFSIGVIDMMGKANVVSAASYGAYKLELYVCVALIYWVSCMVLMLAFGAAERATTRGRRRATA